MSDPPPAREWRFYLDDMIAFTEKVLSYTDGLDQAGFEPSPENLRCYSAQPGIDW
jgi:uncharacterized protein with HEPN domain